MNARNVIAAFLLCTTVAVAQNEPRLWLGGGLGYGIGMFALSGPGTACNFDPACPQYTGGTGGGFLAGLSADWRPWKSFGFLARATYFGSHVTMSTSISDAFARDRNGNVEHGHKNRANASRDGIVRKSLDETVEVEENNVGECLVGNKKDNDEKGI